MKFPKIIMVKVERPRNDEPYLAIGQNLEEIAPDKFNVPETYAVYVLKSTHKLVKQARRV